VFDRFERGDAPAREVASFDGVRRMQAISGGLLAVSERDGRLRMSDLRMRHEPAYLFAFEVAERPSPPQPLVPSEEVSSRDRESTSRVLAWLWLRLLRRPIPTPR
jgi:inner membrane protein